MVLADDLWYFPSYRAVLLYRSDILQRSPSAVAALRALQGRISMDDMRRLNERVKLERVSERDVASDFLATTLRVEGEANPEGRSRRVGRYVVEHLALVAASLSAAIVVAIPLGIAAARRRRLGEIGRASCRERG